ncbi:hypothetical protein FISHEDRAFT_78723 [Fistulina hepatica ATCC 64428]|uniref:Uncharacterized protein n=1 Tax=Fistulina hepatica ATCC 64428 TaxID=1128425 RepID=A0A0D7A0A8_9AGAR|nr:hypothetical protein FISHEDRAFT_78723 [Fistulina hepatica ATCC 64428]
MVCQAYLKLKVKCFWTGEKEKRKVLVEKALPNDEYEKLSEELGLEESGESGGEDEEDKGEVQGPQEDPELVGRMKELGGSFKWMWEELNNELKGMKADVKLMKMKVVKLFGVSGDQEVGLGEAQARIKMGDLLGQVEHPKLQIWAVAFPNAVGWSVVWDMVMGVLAAHIMAKALEEMGAGEKVLEEYQWIWEVGSKPDPNGSSSNS